MIKKAYGFTIVELLIVIVIIAILAAISIVAYRGIQDRANASSASAKATQAATKLKVYYVEHESYPASLSDAGIQDTASFQYTVDNASNPKTYCITATTANKSYYQNTTTAMTPMAGGCPGDSVGGVPAITNLIVNPSFEAGTVSSSWGFNYASHGARTIETTGGASGSNFLRFTVTTATSAGAVGPYTSPRVVVKPDTPYRAIGYVRSNATITYSLNAEIRKSDGTSLGSAISAGYKPISSAWTRLTVDIPPIAELGTIVITAYSPSRMWSPGETVDFDGFMLVEGTTTPNYADGSSPGWTWNGTPNNSSSTGLAL